MRVVDNLIVGRVSSSFQQRFRAEVVILIGWVEDVTLHLSESLKRNGDGDLGLR